MNMIVHRVSPQQARYTPMGGREKCSFCRFYIAPKWCGHVTGPVSPMGWCKYFSQEMRQQFGGSQVVAIGPPGATLDLGFMTPGTIDNRITFTRASTATYTDASGVIQPAAINQPRWDYTGGVLRGLLIEEARTNIWLQSSAAEFWSPAGNVAVAPVVTTNQVLAPDGTLAADRIAYPAVSGANAQSTLYQALTTAAGAYTFSMWLRGAVGGERLYLFITPATPFPTIAVTLTTAWQRFIVTAPALAAGTNYFQIGTQILAADGQQTATPAQTIYAWGAQAEAGTFATSYIPTAAATATRASDAALLAVSGWYVPPGGSWFTEFALLSGSSGGRIIQNTAADNRAPLFLGSGQLGTFDGSAFPLTVNTTAGGVIAKGASAWAPTPLGRVCLNGGAIVASAAMTTGFPTIGPVALFGSATTTTQTSGYLRRVQYWPRVLSDAEMQQVTT